MFALHLCWDVKLAPGLLLAKGDQLLLLGFLNRLFTKRSCCCFAVQAFVVFESPDEAQRACQKDRETFGEKFGDRYVRVYPTLESDVADMQQVVHQQNMVQQVSRSSCN